MLTAIKNVIAGLTRNLSREYLLARRLVVDGWRIKSAMTIFFVVMLFCLPARADEAEIAAQVENYLNGINSFTADFTQMSNGSETGGGKFYIKKPGKFRWEYESGQPVLIVSDGKQLVYYDRKLKEATYAGAKNTLAGLLARREVRFSGDVKLIAATQDNETITVELAQNNKPEQGSLALVFARSPLQITGMVVTDANGQRTDINFRNTVFGAAVDDKLFIFKDPKLHKNVWEK